MKKYQVVTVFVAIVLLAGSATFAQRGPTNRGKMGKGQRGNAAFAADQQLFHFLLTNRQDIRREIKLIEGGVETVTESDRPEVAQGIQKHVGSMEQRVREMNPIHLRDPLFAEVFRHARQIKFEYEKTERGIRVRETSADEYVTRLIRAHAEVVSLFLKNGHAEVQRNHELPARP